MAIFSFLFPSSNKVVKFDADYFGIIFRVTVHLKLEDGSEHSVKAKVGDNLLDIIVDNDLEIDGFGLYYL